MKRFSKISIVGTGALGGYYGGRLLRAGNEVHFLARRDLEALRSQGLEVALPAETFILNRIHATGVPAEIGPCDLVVVTLKATAYHAVRDLIAPLLHERTIILTLENGLGSDEILAAEFGAERIVGGLCFICVNRVGPARVRCLETGSMALGAFGRPATESVRAIADLFSRAGVETKVGDRLAELRWQKLVWNIPFNGLAVAAGGIPTDRILASPALEGEVRALMAEVIEAAAHLGFSIPLEFIDRQIEQTRRMGSYKPSTLIDFLEGREIEVEAIWGEPMRRAKSAGAKVSRLSLLYALLKTLGVKSAVQR